MKTAITKNAITATATTAIQAEAKPIKFKGNLLEDPVLRTVTANGRQVKVANFKVAYNPVDQNGNRIAGATMVPYKVAMWNADATQAGIILKKGSFIQVEGEETVEQNGPYTNHVLKNARYTLLRQ